MDSMDSMDSMQDTVAINLKVLSPSSEVEGGIHLQDLAASTTVSELRRKIQDAVPSHPGPERMRLIYRGKVVANDADTLETLFGADNIRESRDHSLHLVLRELPSTSPTPAPRTATAPPNPFRAAHPPLPASPPLQTNPFRTLPQPRPSSQPPPAPHHHHHAHHPHVHHHVQQPLNPLAPLGAMPLPPHMQQQMAQARGQRGPPMPAPAPATPAQTADGAPPAPDGAPGMLPPGYRGLPAPNGRTVRQEGIGPNGARWSVTYNDFPATVPLRPGQPTMPRPAPRPIAFAIPPRPFGSPPPGGVNVPLSWLLPRLRGTLQEAAREVDNVRTLLAQPSSEPQTASDPSSEGQTAPSAIPAWRVERVREHLHTITHSLNMVESGLSDPAMQWNADVIALRQAAGEVRRQANEFSRVLDLQEGSSPATISDPLLAASTAASATRTLPSDAPPELFLLSSPQGPVGVLFDHRGTYTTAPFTSPPQSFLDQFNHNRHLIATLGQHITQASHNTLGVQPTQPDNPQPAPWALDNAAAHRVIQNILQNRADRVPDPAAPAAPDAPAPADPDRVVNVAGHLWLLFKLACFVYIFAGGDGWHRPLMLASIAVVVYIVQLGLFERQFNVVRAHFEALLPNAERLARGRGDDVDVNHNHPPHQDGRQAPGQDARHPTPHQTARRLLLQQRQNQLGFARDALRALERGVALFVASLWPGIGERLVHAQEERERLERVAVREAEERAEEARRAAEAAQREEVVKTEEDGADEKPVLERHQTESLGEDFMDEAGRAEEKGKGKGKEKAATSHVAAGEGSSKDEGIQHGEAA